MARFRRQERALSVDDCDEISSNVTLKTIARLRGAATHEEQAIAVLENYVATISYNALYDFRRERYPERHRLKKSLRHALHRDPRLALWDAGAGAVAGLKSWEGRGDALASFDVARHDITACMSDSNRPADAMEELLRYAGRPIAFDALVGAVADIWRVRDAIVERNEFPSDPRRDQLADAEQRQYMQMLWQEILELPAGQRAALLLNLRDGGGKNALTLFLLLEVTTVEELAAGIGVSVDTLNEIWEELPLDDLTIAARLGVARQQIINMRKSARARLARRLARFR